MQKACLHGVLVGAISAVLPLAAPAQTTTFTAPSGYTTITAAAAVDASTPKYSFVSHSLAQKRQAAAVITSGGTNSLTVTGAGWGVDDFAGAHGAHYVLIASGPTEGDLFNIVSNTADTLTLEAGAGDLSGLAGESVTIYQHNTLASVFGADPTTKGIQGGLDANTADQIIFYDGRSFTTYFYKTEDLPRDPSDIIGWVVSGNPYVDVSTIPIPPTKGFVILRRAVSALNITVFGDVIDDSVNVMIQEGYNLICVPYPVKGSVTLANSGLYDAADTDFSHSLQPGVDSNNAELVVLWDGTGYQQFFYKDVDLPRDPLDIIGWVVAGDIVTDQGTTELNGGFFILRKAPNPALDWVFPTVVSP